MSRKNPFDDEEVNPFASTPSIPPASNSRLSPLPPEPAGFSYEREATIDIPLDTASGGSRNQDLKKKVKELQAKEAELRKREQEVRRKEEAATRAGVVLEEKNWPPFFPIIHHDIANEIPIHLQRLQYAALSTLLARIGSMPSMEHHSCYYSMDQRGRIWFLSIIFLISGIPGSSVLWHRSLYRAFSGILHAVDLIGKNAFVGGLVLHWFRILLSRICCKHLGYPASIHVFSREYSKAAELKREAARGAMRAAM